MAGQINKQQILIECAHGNFSNASLLRMEQEAIAAELIKNFSSKEFPYGHKLAVQRDEKSIEENTLEEIGAVLSDSQLSLFMQPLIQNPQAFIATAQKEISEFSPETIEQTNVEEIAYYIFGQLRDPEIKKLSPHKDLYNLTIKERKDMFYAHIPLGWLWSEMIHNIERDSTQYAEARALISVKLFQGKAADIDSIVDAINDEVKGIEKFLETMRDYLVLDNKNKILQQLYQPRLLVHNDFPWAGTYGEKYNALCHIIEKDDLLKNTEKDMLKKFFKDEKNMSMEEENS